MAADVPHVIISSSWTDLYGNIASEDFDECFQNLQTETRSVLNTSTPLISASVGGTIKELVNNVSISAVNCMTVSFVILKIGM